MRGKDLISLPLTRRFAAPSPFRRGIRPEFYFGQLFRLGFRCAGADHYKIFSWEAIETNVYYNPDFMKQSEAQGTAIQVEESLDRTIEVKGIPALENWPIQS